MQTDHPPNAGALLDQMSTALIELDNDLNISYLNAAAENLLGTSRNLAIGQPVTQIVKLSVDLLDRLNSAITHSLAFVDRQAVIEPFGQKPQIVDCAITPHSNAKKDPALLIEIDPIERPLRIARDEALLLQQSHVHSMLRGLAHEIKNPLGGLRGAAQLLEKQFDDSEVKEYTSIIIHEADRLKILIERMLGPSSRPKNEPVNVHEVLEHVRKILRVGAPGAVDILFDYDPSIPEFNSDRDRLVQVLLNIAGNALNSVGDEGNIVFRSRVLRSFTIGSIRHPLVAALEVRDDGPGVPEHMIEQIFYPMVSGTDTGTGLGLSIAQSIMNQLGGLIDCHSAPGNTVFRVITPLEAA